LERANLHTALASTNADPEGEIKRSPSLGAVVDRFLFQTKVDYLSQDESRRRMFAKYLCDERPTVLIPYQGIQEVSETAIKMPINDPVLIELHNQILQAVQKNFTLTISDRRACQAIKLAQANALLFERDEVAPDDFMAIMWALGSGHDTAFHDGFKAIATPLIDQVIKDLQPTSCALRLSCSTSSRSACLISIDEKAGHTPDELKRYGGHWRS
jgi:hypothetical protein